jgi:hypothetical protein
MSSILFLNVLDVARSLGRDPLTATPEDVSHWLLREYLKKRGGGFNYNPSITTIYDVFRGAASPADAVTYCLQNGNPTGRLHNANVMRLVGPYAAENVSRCYRIGLTAIAVGRIKKQTVYVGIKAPLVRVREQEAFVVMPGFRMSHRPIEQEIDVACSIALANFARDDFSAADFEYLYAGPNLEGKREFRSIKGRERTVFDRDTVDKLLDVYVRGVALAAEKGAAMKSPTLGGYRIIDPSEPSFF